MDAIEVGTIIMTLLFNESEEDKVNNILMDIKLNYPDARIRDEQILDNGTHRYLIIMKDKSKRASRNKGYNHFADKGNHNKYEE